MADIYQLPYSGDDIATKLSKIDRLETNLDTLTNILQAEQQTRENADNNLSTRLNALNNDAIKLVEQNLDDTEQAIARNNIGAISQDAIPNVLPSPHKLILSGAINAEYDGSEDINVEIPGTTITEILGEETLLADVPNLTIPCEPLKYKKILITCIMRPAEQDAQLIITATAKDGGQPRELLRLQPPAISKSVNSKTSYICWDILPATNFNTPHFIIGSTAGNATYCNIANLYQTQVAAIVFTPGPTISSLPANSTFTIYGVR